MEISTSSQRILRRLSGLIVGIRPSILSIIGIGPLGADHLAQPGRVAWTVAMHELATEARPLLNSAECDLESEVLAALIQWLETDRELECVRWSAAETMLRHMQVVFKNQPQTQSQIALDFLCTTWVTNLTDLTRDVRSGDSSLGRGSVGLIKAIEGSILDLSGPPQLTQQLHQLIGIVDAKAASEFPQPLVAPCRREDLRWILQLVCPQASASRTKVVRPGPGTVAPGNTVLRGASRHVTTQHAQPIDR